MSQISENNILANNKMRSEKQEKMQGKERQMLRKSENLEKNEATHQLPPSLAAKFKAIISADGEEELGKKLAEKLRKFI